MSNASIRNTFGSLLGTVATVANVATDAIDIGGGFVRRHAEIQRRTGAAALEASIAEGINTAHQRLESVGKAYALLDQNSVELAKKLASSY